MNSSIRCGDVPSLDLILEKVKKDAKSIYVDANEISINIKSIQVTMLNFVIHAHVLSEFFDECIYIKTPRGESSLKQEFERVSYFTKHFGSKSSGFGVVEPIAFYENPEAIVFRGVPGTSLHELLCDSCLWFPRNSINETLKATNLVGQWLSSLESVPCETVPSNRVWEHIETGADRAYKRLKKINPGLFMIHADKCMKIIDESVNRAAIGSVCLAHGDFHPENLFVSMSSPCRVVAIDCCLSSPQFVGYDALLFNNHLKLSYAFYKYRPWLIKRIAEAFQKGYSKHIDYTSDEVRANCALIELNTLAYLLVSDRQSSVVKKMIRFYDCCSLICRTQK